MTCNYAGSIVQPRLAGKAENREEGSLKFLIFLAIRPVQKRLRHPP
jgi:hypothetical protein